jgi:hypothetical protein
MTNTRAVRVTNLVLDSENPRIDEGSETPRESIRAMFEGQGDKLIRLAKHVLDHGLNPTERFLLMPHPDERRFIVLEGNRRAAALKLLAEPGLLEGTDAKPRQLKELKKLHSRFKKNPIRSVEAVVVDSRGEAERWIELKHRGELEGAGTVRWGSTEAARFDQRRGRISPELQILDFVVHHAAVAEDVRQQMRKAPITSVRRIISDEKSRTALGIAIDAGGRITSRYSAEVVVQGLARVLDDLGSKRIKVSDIYTEGDRKTYLASIKPDLPKSTDKKGDPHVLEVSGDESATLDAGGGPRSRKGTRGKRSTLVPRSCKLGITDSRIGAIFAELRTLRIDKYPNAIAVLLRVFLELSSDHYIEIAPVTFKEAEANKAGLGHKLTRIARQMEEKKVLTKQQLAGVRKAAVDRQYLSANVVTFHDYVHNKYLNPSPTDLTVGWDNLQLFFEAIWPLKA